MNNNVIAIDGTAGSGKGTISSHIASRLGYYHLDTGVYYRAVTYLTLQNMYTLDNKEEIINVANNLSVDFKDNKVIINGVDLSKEIRTNEVNTVVSTIATIPEVRMIINDKIRKYVGDKKVVIDGRDIGSLVFPNAKYKFYIDCAVGERARRRFNQMIETGIDANYDKILENLTVRDKIDKTHEYGPLVKCEDAILIDTTNDSIDETIEKIINIIGVE